MLQHLCKNLGGNYSLKKQYVQKSWDENDGGVFKYRGEPFMPLWWATGKKGRWSWSSRGDRQGPSHVEAQKISWKGYGAAGTW